VSCYTYTMPKNELDRLVRLNAKADRLADEYADVRQQIKQEVLRLHDVPGVRAPAIAAVIGKESQTVRAWWSEAIREGVLTSATNHVEYDQQP